MDVGQGEVLKTAFKDSKQYHTISKEENDEFSEIECCLSIIGGIFLCCFCCSS